MGIGRYFNPITKYQLPITHSQFHILLIFVRLFVRIIYTVELKFLKEERTKLCVGLYGFY